MKIDYLCKHGEHIKNQDLLKTWLASLFVPTDFRGQHIEEKLVYEVKRIVKELGYSTLYLRTEHTAEYYIKLGWQFLKKAIDEKCTETEVYYYKF